MNLQTQAFSRNGSASLARFNNVRDKSDKPTDDSTHCATCGSSEPATQPFEQQQDQGQAFERLGGFALHQSDLHDTGLLQHSSGLIDTISSLKPQISNIGELLPIKPGIPIKPEFPIGPGINIKPQETELDDPWRDATTPGVHTDVDGELYVGETGETEAIQHTDVVQRGLADCYFMAAVASIAHTNPDAIREMITDNKDGTYTVHFGGELGDVTVDDDLLMNSAGRPLGAQVQNGSDGPELWVAIIEKAYAEGRGTYEDIEWDAIQTGMDDLLGEGTSKVQSAASFDTEDLDAALSSGSPMIASTYSDGDGKKYAENGLVGGHVYSVLGYARDEKGNIRIGEDGKPMIELYNPWGNTEYADSEDTTDDGVFAMSWTEFQEKFNNVAVGESVTD